MAKSGILIETLIISLVLHFDLSAESFIRLNQSGFPGRGRQSRAEETARPRAEGKASTVNVVKFQLG